MVDAKKIVAFPNPLISWLRRLLFAKHSRRTADIPCTYSTCEGLSATKDLLKWQDHIQSAGSHAFGTASFTVCSDIANQETLNQI
jgi:hypothetical protein